MLNSFLSRRAQSYQKGISSPNSSWHSCSRLSPYLTWGQISVRHVVQATKQRQAEIKRQRISGDWGRSLGAFLSRMHWRSHFMQKLEDEPLIEKKAMHTAYNHLRRQEGDWNQQYFEAWVEGRTGFPFVDACMRCLINCGWINFRMRAMVVSFAAYNLWLDWRRFDAPLARLFLDFEPGKKHLKHGDLDFLVRCIFSNLTFLFLHHPITQHRHSFPSASNAIRCNWDKCHAGLQRHEAKQRSGPRRKIH